MHTILCPICEHDDTLPVARQLKGGVTIITVACRQCGLVYHNPVMDDRDRQKAAVSSRQWHTGAVDNARQLRKLEKRWQLQWPLMQPFCGSGARVLEIGCGLGLVGGQLKSRGAEVWAVEPDPDQAAYARQHFGLEVVPLHFEDVSFAGQQFDLIVASHVIEHFPDPLGFLRQLLAYAHPETRLFLETPNILAPKVSYRRMFSPAHNFYFAPETLGWLLAKAGWQAEQCRIFRRDSFQILARPTPPEQPTVDPHMAVQVTRAIKRHRYRYYLKLLFIWRKLPWWQRYWMYRPREHKCG
jgi:2-polyprenyl-3-methyl-5-hydroxy-6-metoxy-1,4-benzoquinol methylase